MLNGGWFHAVLGVLLALCWVGRVARADEPSRLPTTVHGAIAALEDPNNAVAAKAFQFLLELKLPPGVELDEQSLARLRAFWRGPRLEAMLRDPDPAARIAAANGLQEAGKADERYPSLLAELLKDSDKTVRIAAAGALGSMGEAARAQAPLLVGLLKSDEQVRPWAARALNRLGEAARDQAPMLAGLLGDSDAQIRLAAIQALEGMGAAAREQAPVLVLLLKDPDSNVRQEAARALGGIGEAAQPQVPALLKLVEQPGGKTRTLAVAALVSMGQAMKGPAPLLDRFLKDPDPSIRQAALGGLDWRGKASAAQAPLAGKLLKDPNVEVRKAAAGVLWTLGRAAKEQALLLGDALKDPDPGVRAAAAAALGRMGEGANAQLPLLVELLEDPERNVRSWAVWALGNMGEPASTYAPRLVGFLKDPDWGIRGSAEAAVGRLGQQAHGEISRLVAALLSDPDAKIRALAARVLGSMGEAAKEQAPLLGRLLRDSDMQVRKTAAEALGNIGPAAKEQVPLLIHLLVDAQERAKNSLLGSEQEEAMAAATALGNMAPLELASIAPLIAQTTTSPAYRSHWLVSAHIAGGGEARVERLLRWLGRPSNEAPIQELPLDVGRETLKLFAEFWPMTESYPELRHELASQIGRVVLLEKGQWKRGDLGLLRLQEKNLREWSASQTETASVEAVIRSVQQRDVFSHLGWGWVAHAGFWLLLLVFYPRSPRVQALFFWNPWVRKIAGLGYVSLLLTWVPWLRRRLLAPFAPLLLADADLERFSPDSYFPRSEVSDPFGQRRPLLAALPRLGGQIILEGDSGLGKSMFLKYLLCGSKRLAVFLPAERCRGGVLEAIQARLEGQAQDTTFLRSIIYSGALDIYIDGLNEVTAATREKISQFTERNVHANILLATQRIEWALPATARRYVLQPLSDAEVVEFLVSREPLLEPGAKLRGPSYQSVCEDFVHQALAPAQPEELLRAMREVLANPLDLTVVAQMLAAGHVPDLFHLRQQQYALMAEDYRRKYLAPFPLGPFSEAAYQMRLKDAPVIPEEPFSRELPGLEAFKIVLRRQWQSPDGEGHREWRFRHDKFHEFFIAQALLETPDSRLTQHVGDPRFHGVYSLLALLLEPQKARQLRDLLVEHAATTQDHTLSDRFVLLFKERHEAEQAQASVRLPRLGGHP
ncbi:HEAT repeat domain-containing protein [Hyalangium versicolor]|uniref:HEAT repeat domain-containing protein n=1 Tax=Hyalangium versicolor TaxID=2861190 RepID=UPI001CCC3F60|nr:HEAT repeat domain-containing protein [Hyalangium versicolor]